METILVEYKLTTCRAWLQQSQVNRKENKQQAKLSKQATSSCLSLLALVQQALVGESRTMTGAVGTHARQFLSLLLVVACWLV